jgi:hypothetical protein
MQPSKKLHVEMIVAFLIGTLEKRLCNKNFHEDYMDNVDEINFIINRDNGKNWGFEVKARLYANVVSNGEKITMIVRMTCSRPTIITAPMMIFTNMRHVYPIRGVENDVCRVCYCTRPRGWINSELLA